ncbi:MAG: hypothetical protein R2849_11040 [Thermomicrobiales bacterium]
MLTLHAEPIDPSDPGDADRLLELQKLAYRIEADLIGFDGIPPLHETLEELTALPLAWLGIRSDGRIVAVIGYTVEGGICDIDRLFVDPAASWARIRFGPAVLAPRPSTDRRSDRHGQSACPPSLRKARLSSHV